MISPQESQLWLHGKSGWGCPADFMDWRRKNAWNLLTVSNLFSTPPDTEVLTPSSENICVQCLPGIGQSVKIYVCCVLLHCNKIREGRLISLCFAFWRAPALLVIGSSVWQLTTHLFVKRAYKEIFISKVISMFAFAYLKAQHQIKRTAAVILNSWWGTKFTMLKAELLNAMCSALPSHKGPAGDSNPEWIYEYRWFPVQTLKIWLVSSVAALFLALSCLRSSPGSEGRHICSGSWRCLPLATLSLQEKPNWQ